SATRDILGHKPHSEVDHRGVFSIDPETQTRFEKRLPFQVQACWSSAVVLRLSRSVLSALPFSSSGDPEPDAGADECAISRSDERMVLANQLWKQHSRQQQQTSGAVSVNESQSHPVARVVVVPAVHFASSAHEYIHQGLFDGWGLWPSTAQQYRDALEAKFVAMSRHPLYGYRPSTSSYGYIPRVKEEKVVPIETDATTSLEREEKEGDLSGANKDQGSSTTIKLEEGGGTRVESVAVVKNSSSNADDETGSPSMLISEEVLPLLKARLEEINAVFGVQDIEDAVLTKQEAELIVEWRDVSRQGAGC
ncbi:hypothetical protein BGZ70_004088, partial [Mortierella alpina]